MDEPISRQLVTHAASINSLRQDLNRLASEMTDAVAGLLERLESLAIAAPHDRSGLAWCWRDIGEAAGDELARQVGDWVTWIRNRYPLARKIPRCWAEHPETVEELTALWLAWQAAYQDPNASLTAPADWHDHWLPGFLHRLEHGPFALNCSSSHQTRPKSAYGTAADEESSLREHPSYDRRGDLSR